MWEIYSHVTILLCDEQLDSCHTIVKRLQSNPRPLDDGRHVRIPRSLHHLAWHLYTTKSQREMQAGIYNSSKAHVADAALAHNSKIMSHSRIIAFVSRSASVLVVVVEPSRITIGCHYQLILLPAPCLVIICKFTLYKFTTCCYYVKQEIIQKKDGQTDGRTKCKCDLTVKPDVNVH